MAEESTSIEIFCCYAHEDEMWLSKLETHLSLLKRQKIISLWHDRLVVPGTDWAKTIDTHLETASVILLLVSSDFFASDYCSGIEMQRALEREAAGEALVIPILVRPTDRTDAPFARLQVLPTDARPIASWRNKDTALSNVVAGLRRVIAEELPLLSVSVPRTALPKTWNIPYPRNPFFLGRDAELLQVRQNLQTGQATALSQPQAINGLGGIGKTQLALEYAYRYHRDYTAVLWAHAESIETLISSYVTLATLLRLPEREAKEQGITVQAVKIWLQTHRGWLLILDNADDLILLSNFLPPSFGGHLLLTTRAAATGRLAWRLSIETLLPEQGALLLLRRSGLLAPDAELSHALLQEREWAERLSQELGGLPLALDQAGAYLEETGTDLVSYWSLYQRHRADVLRERRGLVADHPASVATTWSLSFQRVEERGRPAADLLRLLAFLSPDAIPEEILTNGAPSLGPELSHVAVDAFRLNQTIETLRAYSLVQRDPKGKTLSVHRLVQAVLQDAQPERERRVWAERAMLAVNAAFPKSEVDTWSQCERLLPQALAAGQLIERYQLIGEEAGRLLSETADYLLDQVRHREAEPLYLCALHIREQQLGEAHPYVAYSLTGLAHLYREQGKYAQAEPLYLHALHIREQQLGPEDPYMASPLTGLASLYRKQGEYAKAEPLYLRALHIREQRSGPQHPHVAYPLTGLADLYYGQGEYAKAEPLYLRALHIREQQLGETHPETAQTIHDLARLRETQGNSEEARAWYARALAIREQTLGAHHPKTAETRKRLIALLSTMEQHEQATRLEVAETEP